MTAPYKRRRDPTPMTQGWEVAVVGIGLGVILLVLAALAGIGVAAALFGAGWVWPHGTDTIVHTLGGFLGGHLGRGLPPADAHRLAGPATTWLCVVVCELIVIVGGITAGIAIAQRVRNDGMATRRDAELVLGLGELRSARAIIRPDLYGAAAADQDRASSRLRFGRRKETT